LRGENVNVLDAVSFGNIHLQTEPRKACTCNCFSDSFTRYFQTLRIRSMNVCFCWKYLLSIHPGGWGGGAIFTCYISHRFIGCLLSDILCRQRFVVVARRGIYLKGNASVDSRLGDVRDQCR
jgi:hypothetical protein